VGKAFLAALPSSGRPIRAMAIRAASAASKSAALSGEYSIAA
jgi:hypothetical protein